MHTILIIMKKVPFYFYIDSTEVSVEQQSLFSEYKTWMAMVCRRNCSCSPNDQLFMHSMDGFYGFREVIGADIHFGAFYTPIEMEFKRRGAVKISLDYWKEEIKDRYYQVVGAVENYCDDYDGSHGVGFNSSNTVIRFKKRYDIYKMPSRDKSIAGALSDDEKAQMKANSRKCEGYTGGWLIDRYHTEKSKPYGWVPYQSECVDLDYAKYPLHAVKTKINKDLEDGIRWIKCQITGNYASEDNAQMMTMINEEGDTVTGTTIFISVARSTRYNLAFTSPEAAENFGLVHCRISCDWVKPEDVREVPNANYHQLRREWKTARGTAFTVGFEIEKEDEDARNNVGFEKLYSRTKWCKERDGSLNCDTGYELVSPVYDLFSNKMENDIKNDSQLLQLINASYSDRCGGHINIGSTTYSPIQMLFGLKGFLPLLYSIWRARIGNNFSTAMKAHEYGEGKNAIKIKERVLEIRIASAVKSLDNMLWRRDLVRIMMKNINKSEQEVLRMMLNPRSVLHRHLRKVYNSERFMKKCNDFVKYAEKFNNIKLDDLNWDNLDGAKGESNPETDED